MTTKSPQHETPSAPPGAMERLHRMAKSPLGVGLGAMLSVASAVRAATGTALNNSEDPASTHQEVTASPTALPPCEPDAETLCFLDKRYKVQVFWEIAPGNTGTAKVAKTKKVVEINGEEVEVEIENISDNSGNLWFFGPENWEMLIKILSACELGGHNWVFHASTTNVGFTLRAVDTITGEEAVYTNEKGHPASTVLDTSAFECVEPRNDTLQTRMNTTVSANLLANDYGMVEAAGLKKSSDHGDAHLDADGSFTFTPDIGWVGTEELIYLAFDKDGRLFECPLQVTVTP